MSYFEKYLLFSVVAKMTYWEWEREERKLVKTMAAIFYIMMTLMSVMYLMAMIAGIIVGLLA